jgi:hypothetical protein
MVIPEVPVSVQGADRFYTIQSQLELVHDTLTNIAAGLNIRDLSTFGEHKSTPLPTFRDFASFEASTHVKASSFVKKIRKMTEQVASLTGFYSDTAVCLYVKRSSEATERERHRVQTEIDRIRAEQARQNQQIADLEAQLGRPTNRRRIR